MSLHFLEDWLLCLGGHLKVDGSPTRAYTRADPPISMAAYDKKFVNSVSEALNRNLGLTDKQVVLGVKVVTKYQRQWSLLGVDPSYLLHDDVPLRLGLRVIDRTQSIVLEGNEMKIKFPYNKDLVTGMHRVAPTAPGAWAWDNEAKIWTLDYTEGNIHVLATLPNFNDVNFDVSPVIRPLLASATGKDALPVMYMENGKLAFRNVPEQAAAAMVERGWEPEATNLMHWSLLARKHGIDLDESVVGQLEYGSALTLRQTAFDGGTGYGISSTTWDDLENIMTRHPAYTYLFYYRTSAITKVEKRISHVMATKRFVDTSFGQTAEIVLDGLIVSNTIVITDTVIGNLDVRSNIASRCLGMLYMIADDERSNANNETGNKR